MSLLYLTHRFREWPNEALKSVAYSFFQDVELTSGPAADSATAQQDTVRGVVESCVYVHQSVEKKSKKFYDELRRYVCVCVCVAFASYVLSVAEHVCRTEPAQCNMHSVYMHVMVMYPFVQS